MTDKYEIVECERRDTYWYLVYQNDEGTRRAHVIPPGSLERWLLVNVECNDPFTALGDMLMWMLDYTGWFDAIEVPYSHQTDHVAHHYAASVDMATVQKMRAVYGGQAEMIGMPRISVQQARMTA